MVEAALSNPTSRGVKAPPRQVGDDLIDETVAQARLESLKGRVWIQTWIIVVLTLLLAGIVPFARPYYLYYALTPEKKVSQLVGLTMPNMTNRAILSWSTTSITEIMTMGFGDMDIRLPLQKWRFTSAGWTAFGKAFARQKINQKFKQNQLVLTTAPSNTPVIVSQGINVDDVYQWTVQMPVILTYATNNNVTDKKNAIVTLTIVRVPAKESTTGIAIDSWQLKS